MTNPVFLQANCNLICADEYGPETKLSMSQLNEKETPFELIEALLKYIETLNVPGAVLVFLPGWNLIYTMQKHLENNSHFGMTEFSCFRFTMSMFTFILACMLLCLMKVCVMKNNHLTCSFCSYPFCIIGSHRYQILPLHSQIPREEQRKVFDPVPDGVTKVRRELQ